MGRIVGERPSSIHLLGAGRWAFTSRSRFPAVRRYLNWLALNHDIGYPRELDHVTGYLLARQSEPCTRNALRGAHTAIVFMEEVAGVETVGEADGDASVRNHPEGAFGQHASEQAGEAGSKDARRDYFNARKSGGVRIDIRLPSHLCVVDFGAVVGDPEIR